MSIAKREKLSVVYVSIFIALLFHFPIMLSVFGKTDFYKGLFLDFILIELIYQFLYQILFSCLIGFIALRRVQKVFSYNLFNIKMILIFILFTIVFWFIGIKFQELIFNNISTQDVFYRRSLIRSIITSALMFLTIKILQLNKQNNFRELENEKLKSSFLNSKLENLKAQINPHFLFNSFANLSALINQNQQKATKYLSNLSDVFRYSLINTDIQIIDLVDELALLDSYIELYKIRMQGGLSFHIDVPDAKKKILHMSFQPLIENVINHNVISQERPLCISLIKKGNSLIFKNDLNIKNKVVNSNGIGLTNLNERYKILVGKEINIQKSEKYFSVELPLI